MGRREDGDDRIGREDGDDRIGREDGDDRIGREWGSKRERGMGRREREEEG